MEPNIPETQSITIYMFVVSNAIAIIGPVTIAVKITVHFVIYGDILLGISNFMKLFLAVMIRTGNAAIFKNI